MRSTTPSRVYSGGVDLLDLERFETAVTRIGERLTARISSAEEGFRINSTSPYGNNELAGCFSMKESVVKALGGVPPGSGYTDMVIDPPQRHRGGERPVRLTGELAAWADLRGVDVVTQCTLIRERLVCSWAFAVSRG